MIKRNIYILIPVFLETKSETLKMATVRRTMKCPRLYLGKSLN